jgi:predicted nucleotidyltransferase
VIAKDHFSSDALEFLQLLYNTNVEYLIIGGEAVIYYGFARLTGDIDLFYHRTPGNIENLYKALTEFWGGSIPGLDEPGDLDDRDAVFQFGVPPNRLDLLADLENVPFKEAWKQRRTETIQLEHEQIEVYFIGLDHLIENKKNANRPKDQEDLKYLTALKNGKTL